MALESHDLSADFSSDPIELGGRETASIELNITSTSSLVGTITANVHNEKDSTGVEMTWQNSLDTVVTSYAVSGSSIVVLDLGRCSSGWVTIHYSSTSGTGSMTIAPVTKR